MKRMLSKINSVNGFVGAVTISALVLSTLSSSVAASARSSHQLVKMTPGEWVTLRMVNKSDGWGVLYHARQGATLIRTLDGGKSWHNVSPSGTSTSTPTGFNFVTGEEAWIVMQPDTRKNLVNTNLLVLYHTVNGGRNWSSVDVPLHAQTIPVQTTELSVIDGSPMYMDIIPQHGMGSMPGQLMLSRDGGKAWTPVKTPSDIPFGGSLEFVNAKIGWLSTSDATTTNLRLYRTTNGGTKWREIHVPVPEQYKGYEQSVAMPQFKSANSLNGSLQVRFQKQGQMAQYYALYSTKDLGRSWHFVGTLPGQFSLVSFPSPSVGFHLPMTSSKTFPMLYETSDGGKAWSRFVLPKDPFETLIKNYIPAQMEFVSKSVGWINWGPRSNAKNTNQIWMTKNSGHTWHKVWS